MVGWEQICITGGKYKKIINRMDKISNKFYIGRHMY